MSRYSITILTAVSAATVFFQNCTNLVPFGLMGTFQTASVQDNGPYDIQADFFWNSLGPKSGLRQNRIAQISSWTDSVGESVKLFPPLQAGSGMKINIDASPIYVGTSSGPLVALDDSQSLTIEAGEIWNLLGQKYSLAMYVRELRIPTTQPTVIRLIEMPPADDSASGYLAVDAMLVDANKAVFRTYEYYDGNTMSYSDVEVAKADLDKGFGLGIRFSNDPKSIRLSVNGKTGKLTSVGTVPFLGNVNRPLNIHSTTGAYGNKGGFKLAGLAIWKTELSDYFIDGYSQSFQNYFESGGAVGLAPTLKPAQPTPPSSSTLTFGNIQALLSVCVTCHAEASAKVTILTAVGADGKTSWINPNHGYQSLLIQTLLHQTGVQAMPKNNNALPADQITQITNWIDQGAN